MIKPDSLEKISDVLDTIKAVKGDAYAEIVAINCKINSVLALIHHMKAPLPDKLLLTIMVTGLGHDLVQEWEKGRDKDLLKRYAETLEADVTTLMSIVEERRG